MAALPDSNLFPALADAAWNALLGIAGQGGDNSPTATTGLLRRHGGGWEIHPDTPAACRDLLSLYLPLVAAGAEASWVVGHLGQSLNGCIATHAGESRGDSCSVTGQENIMHLHRMRALCDAVLVGASTVADDDPRLTTRLVPGPSPVRVVLDPVRRLSSHHRVFQDGAAPTMVCVGEGQRGTAPGVAERLAVPTDADGLRLDLLVQALAARGLKRLFIEGGGVTVSRFLTAGCLSRLQIAVAPLLIGQGRPGLDLPRCERLADALRLAPRVYRMGTDLLYDLELGAVSEGGLSVREPCAQGLERVL